MSDAQAVLEKYAWERAQGAWVVPQEPDEVYDALKQTLEDLEITEAAHRAIGVELLQANLQAQTNAETLRAFQEAAREREAELHREIALLARGGSA